MSLPQPIPVKNLVVEDVADGDAKIGGSFRGALKPTGNTGLLVALPFLEGKPGFMAKRFCLEIELT